MARYCSISLLIVCTCFLTGCQSRNPLKGDHPPEMVGPYRLLIRSSCDQYKVKTDILVLRADGTFDQVVLGTNGQRFTAKNQKWHYDPDEESARVSLDQRLEFFLPEMFGKKPGEPSSIGENLIVTYENGSPVIVLNPDWDCVYIKADRPELYDY